mmetsp:Transcript_22727/g.49779  ORF Transcript_22727/g.49779 Transcript_22727/m.49779 type:complete len:213 (-) Transcript_22727:668-1306(-)|eukprot:CAMPEP_0118934498 /NCGR_PEP_ID=MMETSP1169-20130426/13858_1 /TAXON_ID=36882 /ORGANISM="Pyramimonas obovata, Strain CCMP722" /LENGTH=212 /DNA_ID=CAMNT_0006877409 /DNA_START=294 /DNA_END=932 /DNA_ORIENTATION=-
MGCTTSSMAPYNQEKVQAELRKQGLLQDEPNEAQQKGTSKEFQLKNDVLETDTDPMLRKACSKLVTHKLRMGFLGNPALNTLVNNEEVEMLLDKLVRVKISDKDVVYEEGESAENMFIIESGIYEVHQVNRGLVSTMVDGSFGEGAMQPSMRQNTVIAKEGGHLWALSRENFEAVTNDKLTSALSHATNAKARAVRISKEEELKGIIGFHCQ